jgi:PAS domain S-box-containing protein
MEVVPGAAADERYVEFIYQPVKDTEGNVTGIFVEGVDVTERKLAEAAQKHLNETLELRIEERTEQLLSKEALIATFYTHSSEYHAVIAETESGRFRYDEANPALLRMYGKTREELIGRTVDEVFEPEAAAELTGHLRACLLAGTPYRYERRNGDAIVEAVATPVPQARGTARLLIVSARDITEHRNLEQQLRQSQKMEAVGQLTGGIAHDFNNLLTGVTGSLELMEKRFEQRRFDDIDRYLHAAKGAAKRAAALTHRLLAFSRRQTLDPRPTDVNSLVSDMEELIRRTIGSKNQLRIRWRHRTLENSRRFTPAGKCPAEPLHQCTRRHAARRPADRGDLQSLDRRAHRARPRLGGGTVYLPVRQRQWNRHVRRGDFPSIRSVLYHQTPRRRHGPWTQSGGSGSSDRNLSSVSG